MLSQDVPRSLGGVVRSDFREEVLRTDVLERGRMALKVLFRDSTDSRIQRNEASLALRTIILYILRSLQSQ